MGKDGELERKGKWSLKSLLKPGLRHRSFRKATARHGNPSLPPLQAAATDSPPTASGGPSTPPSTAPGVHQSGDAGDSAQGPAQQPNSAAAACTALSLAGRSLVVQVLQARRLRAADSNGLSDPYCIVKVGDHKASSKTELKTLEPRWNETMCFSPADVAEALEDNRPYVSFRVFDWDLVSADDFLGQCELPFEELSHSQAAAVRPRWLPLYGFGRGGRRVEAGEIYVAAWFETGSAQGHSGGSAVSTLCCQPGTRKQVPQVVHSQRGVLYEEPLIACLAITLDRVEGVPVRSTAASAAAWSKASDGYADSGSPPPRTSSTPLSWLAESPVGAGGGKLFGRIFHRKRNSSGSMAGGGRALTASLSMRSSVSDGMLAGEDPGDEYGGLNFYEQEASGLGPLGSEAEYSMGVEEEEDVTQHAQQQEEQEPGTPMGSHERAHSEGSQPLYRSSLLTELPSFVAREEGQPTGGLSGMRMYVRLVLGRQKQTSWIKKERNCGTTNWHQTFVFAAPLPLRDRQLRVELYRTGSSTQKGRLISIAHVWLRDLVPPGLSSNPETCKQNTLELDSVLRHQSGGRVLLRSTLVDTDLRRSMYQAPFVEGEEEHEEAGGSSGTAHQPLQRLESMTQEYSQKELIKKALHSEQSFVAWKGSRHRQAKVAARNVGQRAIELAQYSFHNLSRYFSSDQEITTEVDASSEPSTGVPTLAQPKLPEPAGTLLLTIHNVSLPTAGTDCFWVLKCGPHWGRSSTLALAGRTSVDCNWQLSLPVLDPAAILTLALFQHSRGLKATEKLRPGFLPTGNAVQVVGKLRVRLSCLRPNMPHTAELVLLGERAKGAHEAGMVKITLETSYPSPMALFKGYAAPRLPPAAYAHGVDGKCHQVVMARECRRIVLRWLDSANPSIGSLEALAVLDAEREVFAMSRTRVNIRRIRMALVGLRRFQRKFEAIKTWQEPWESVAAMAGILLLCFAPHLALPLLLAWVVATTLTAQPEFEEGALRMEQDPPDIEPENESLETTTVNPLVNLRAKVERLQRMGLLVQNILDDVASFMERAGALLSWQDPSVTLGVLGVLSGVALLIFFLGLPIVSSFLLCFVIRPPALRTPTPPLPAVVFAKLPTRGDRIV